MNDLGPYLGVSLLCYSIGSLIGIIIIILIIRVLIRQRKQDTEKRQIFPTLSLLHAILWTVHHWVYMFIYLHYAIDVWIPYQSTLWYICIIILCITTSSAEITLLLLMLSRLHLTFKNSSYHISSFTRNLLVLLLLLAYLLLFFGLLIYQGAWIPTGDYTTSYDYGEYMVLIAEGLIAFVGFTILVLFTKKLFLLVISVTDFDILKMALQEMDFTQVLEEYIRTSDIETFASTNGNANVKAKANTTVNVNGNVYANSPSIYSHNFSDKRSRRDKKRFLTSVTSVTSNIQEQYSMNAKEDLTQSQMLLIRLAIKNTILTLIAIFSFLVYILILMMMSMDVICISPYNNPWLYDYMVYYQQTLVVAIEMICVLLIFKDFDECYNCGCKCCHLTMQKCCIILAQKHLDTATKKIVENEMVYQVLMKEEQEFEHDNTQSID